MRTVILVGLAVVLAACGGRVVRPPVGGGLPATQSVDGVQYVPVATKNTLEFTDVSSSGRETHELTFEYLNTGTLQVSGAMIQQDLQQPAVVYPARANGYAAPSPGGTSYSVFELEMLELPPDFAKAGLAAGDKAEVTWSPTPSGGPEIRVEKKWTWTVESIQASSVSIRSDLMLRVPKDAGFDAYVEAEVAHLSDREKLAARTKIAGLWAPSQTWFAHATCDINFDPTLPGPSSGKCALSDGLPGSPTSDRTISFTTRRGN
jgi:hypothetical protein